MVMRLILLTRISLVLFSKSKPTWTHRHRDRIAFVRIVSGEFERGMSVNLTRTGKGAKLSNVTQFMAESRENVENAVAGDIIGVYDTGTYQVGDTLTVGKKQI